MPNVGNLSGLARVNRWSMSDITRVVQDLGGDPAKVLGCGSVGCTIQAEEGYVLKFTSDESEYSLWLTMDEMQRTGHRTTRGVPKVHDLGVVHGLGKGKAFYVIREAVEPLVMGNHMNIGPRTRKYLFGQMQLPPNLPMDQDWSFERLAGALYDSGFRVTREIAERCARFDEDLRKLYELTTITDFSEVMPSIRKQFVRTYVAMADSCRPPFDGLGKVIASVLKDSGTTWVTDLHMGNLGWRLQSKPQVLAYDWLASELVPNGKLV